MFLIITALVLSLLSSQANVAFAAPTAAPTPPEVLAGVKVELVGEGVDQSGRWFQTFRVTIRSGGTLSDAAMAIYNDVGRTEEVFQAARAQNPYLTNPAYVHVGTQIELTVDPTAVFVYKETQREQGGALEKIVYFNGVVETYYKQPRAGLLRTVDFPPEPRAQSFTFRDEFRGTPETVTAKPGTRLVDYRYVEGDSFGDVVRKIYGRNSVKAANELLTQSGWDPNKWPPADGGQTRIFVNSLDSYADAPPTPLDFAPADPAASQAWQRLTAERAALGIYPLRMAEEGIVYRVMVGDGTVTAKRVAKLLFNDEAKAPTVARAAGFPVPAEGGAGPASDDPLLVGRSFELEVPFLDERFPLVERVPTGEPGGYLTRLANGTIIHEYDREPGQSGLLLLAEYPNGYKKIITRPSGLLLGVLDFLHFQLVNIANADLPREQRVLMTREFQARMVWTWSRSLPRDVHDEVAYLHLDVGKDDTTLAILTRRRGAVPWHEALLFDLWFTYPLVAAGVMVALGTVALFALSLQARRRQASRRDRIKRGSQ